jgi:Carboxypeptidase regulatory-like domain
MSPSGSCLYSTAGSTPGLLSLPVGMMADYASVPYTACVILPPFTCVNNPTAAQYIVKLPGSVTDSCVGASNLAAAGTCYDGSGFDLKTGISGSVTLLDPVKCPGGNCTGDPTCTPSAPGSPGDPRNTNPNSCWSQDVQIIQAAQATNPPCIQGVTVCISNSPKGGSPQNVTLTNPINGTSTFVNPITGVTKVYQGYTYTPANCPNKPGALLVNGSCIVTVIVQPVSQKIWYLYRVISSLTLQIVPPTVTPYCVSSNTPNNFCNGAPSCPIAVSCTWNPTGALQTFAPNAITELNKVSTLTNTQIAFGLSVPSFAALSCSQQDIQTGNCWWGFIGLWLGAQGIQTAGCAQTAATCSFTIGTGGVHAQLPLYTCSQMNQGCAGALPVPGIITGLATANNLTVAQVVASQAPQQIYSYITTQNFGATYACQGGASCPTCLPATLSSCFTSPTPLVVNVPLVADILGTQQLANWFYQYPAIPPNGGALTGNIFGTVTDQSGNPISGACVGINGLCSFATGQYQRVTGPTGKYTFANANLPAGVYSVFASSPGFIASYSTGVNLAVGGLVQVDFALSPIPQPPNQVCLIPPIQIPNPNPFAPPTYTPGLLCLPPIPWWFLPSVLGILGLGIFALIAYSPAGQAGGSLAGALIKTRLGKKR